MRLNLWHGIPLKNLASIKQKGKKFSELKILLRRILVRKSREYFVHPNRKYISHVLGVFHIPEKNVFIANLPRNEIFFNTVADAARVKSHDSLWRDRIQTLRNQGQMIVGYFPTWRSDGEDLFLGISEAKYINKLNEMLVENKLTIITKWHTCSYDEYQHDGRSHTAYKLDRAISSQSNILSLDFPTDLNSVLTHCDALVPDYSSVLFDFLFTDRPQFFVPYDLDRYCSSTGLLFDYESFVPGPVILDSSRLITAVSALREGKDVDIYSGRRAELRKTFFENEQCSSHIMKLMESIS
jgi:CDP-glycerol glycerophosphotransferase (TagB/SpsB family)